MKKAIAKFFALGCFSALAGNYTGAINPEIIDSFESTLVTIKKGSFVMGSPIEEKDRSADEEQVPVEIHLDFFVMKTEVTQLQYFNVMGSNPSHFSKKEHCPDSHTIIDGVELCPENPVERVSYREIVDSFLPKLYAATGKTYRLLTENEWEYAARAGTTTAYSFDAEKISDYAWTSSNSRLVYFRPPCVTHPVATKLPNPAGLYDMHGNVAELVSSFYYRDEKVRQSLMGYGGYNRVYRGGSANYYNFDHDYRSASREDIDHYSRFDYVGFRLARDLSLKELYSRY